NQLLIVYAATGVILLIACLNVSNLLLIRGEARRREFAIRCALGSSRIRLIRQLLIESATIAFLGAVAGLLLASYGRILLVHFAPPSLGLSGAFASGSVLLATALVALIAAILSGLAPAIRLTNTRSALQDAGRSSTAGRSRHRLLSALVIGQIAVS